MTVERILAIARQVRADVHSAEISGSDSALYMLDSLLDALGIDPDEHSAECSSCSQGDRS